ncbi:MAG TPA: hypothetical protein VH187_22310 [Scandinavium sp.]|jgi:hypothetical protein|uniref:hypothetical protein n=1 Tax=Scandinavium sp. TaxID=2830653 RepID=UPI002E36C412|nr:hypothetical protein [Scandinavium sp.]HEX4503869.1 hypothetical protein [Scandinavium sp.]
MQQQAEPKRAGFWGTAPDGKRQQRALLASATNISNGMGSVNRIEAARLRKLKQLWQEDAWAYRDSIGELRYATTFLGNAARKVELFPAAYVQGELDPIPLEDIPECPANIMAAANDAMQRLAANPSAMAGMLRDIAENFEVAGECSLLGWAPNTYLTGDNNEEVWEIRSVSEVTSNNDGEILIKDAGETGSGTPLPDGSFYSRLWYPHPRRKALADSPFAAILDICEELLILSRDIRAAGRSRLANSGLLLLPDGLTVIKSSTTEDANDDEQDPFLQELVAAAMTAIQDEGSASAILPIIIRGPVDALAGARQLTISRPDAQNATKRIELLERMATSVDLPAEVLTGKADLNHWTAWSVSDDTFSDHIEPLVMVMDDALTAGYLRVMLAATEGLDPEWVNKVLIWHNATRLVRHPDRSQDAIQAYDRMALSQAALRDTMGFPETMAPAETEILERLVVKQTRLDPTIAAQLIKRMDQTLDISAVVPAPGAPAQSPPAGAPVGRPSSGISPPSSGEGPPQGGEPQQPVPPPPAAAAASLVAAPKAADAHIKQGNAKLAKIESDLMSKVQTAANAAMSRALERAGARIRTNVSKTASGRAWCVGHSNIELCFLISNSMIAAAGLDEQTLLNDAWGQLQTQWREYLDSASIDTASTIAKMLKMPVGNFVDMADRLSEGADAGWSWLEQRLSQVAKGYLTDSASVAGEAEEITTTSLVPWDIIKEAISRVGGQPTANSPGVAMGDSDPTTVTPMTGITSGPIVSDTMSENDMNIGSYTWVHGYVPKPFQPHEDLDGVEFHGWTDDVLANTGGFPDRDYYMPGDHDGCGCDFYVNWESQETSQAEE